MNKRNEDEDIRYRTSLLELEPGMVAKVSGFRGGNGFKRRLGARGILVGKEIRMITRQPAGPVVVGIGPSTITLGRGMARKIFVEVEE
mgnify:CR=1 FL=1